jgi:bacteriorhodopsin
MSNTFMVILFPSILCTTPNQRKLFHLIVSIIVGFLTFAYISLLVNILKFSFSLSYTDRSVIQILFLRKYQQYGCNLDYI